MANAKTAEQHLADAMTWKLDGLKVIGPAKQFKDNPAWFILCECLSCGKQQWLQKTKLRYITHCGCQKYSLRKKVKPEKVELTEAQKEVIDMELNKDKNVNERMIDVLEKKLNSDRVSVPRRLILGLAGNTKKMWTEEDIWNMPPALFNTLINDTIEIYEALNGAKQ